MPISKKRSSNVIPSNGIANALRTALTGVFEQDAVLSDAQNQSLTHFQNGVVSEAAREVISFRQLNLHGPWPMTRSYDLIFCRNVAIYFDDDLQQRLWERLIAQLRPGGWLCMGHSERLPSEIEGELTCVGQTTYQKPKSSARS